MVGRYVTVLSKSFITRRKLRRPEKHIISSVRVCVCMCVVDTTEQRVIPVLICVVGVVMVVW